MRHEGGFGGHSNFAPVKVGEVIEAKIEAVGEKGDGIVKVKGFVIFVPGVKQGDEVKIKINKVLRKVAFGEVVSADTAASSESSESSEQSEEAPQESESHQEEQDNKEDSENF